MFFRLTLSLRPSKVPSNKTVNSLMSRRQHSSSPSSSPRLSKRPRLNGLTPDDFKDGVMLAPMVRSGALPTRWYALKHGAKLVWAPEIVDKAILHAERVVDPKTGVVNYNGKSRAMFTTHPLEKPYLIYQIGSADPKLAVEAAKTVLQDVSGVDLNCGCPKPFSTHAGMGAALLSTPDLLCDILTALRRELPEEVTVSAKIRLLPTQEETLKLVERIVNTGVSALTVHCRTRNMRPRERAIPERLKEIVEFVEKMGKDVAVIGNGDCVSWEDAKRFRDITGAHSVMIATAAESNPTCFDPHPLVDLETTLIPPYIRMCAYLDNHWTSTKWCIAQFKSAHRALTKAHATEIRGRISQARGYDNESTEKLVEGVWNGEEVFNEIKEIVQARNWGGLGYGDDWESRLEKGSGASGEAGGDEVEEEIEAMGSQESDNPVPMTPKDTDNPEPVGTWAPLGPSNELRMPVPAMISGEIHTPTRTLSSPNPDVS